MELKKILVPMDQSAHAQKALQKAIYLAQRCEAKLVLLYVVDLNQKISAFEQVSTGGYVPAELKEEGYRFLAEAMRRVPQGIEAEMAVEIGQPSEVIVQIAARETYEMIIMGSRGLGKLKQIFMGSVSQYVLCHAPCPVLVVR